MIPCCCEKGKSYVGVNKQDCESLMIRHQLQCYIWIGAIIFKEDVNLPARFGAGTGGKMRFPKAWTVMKGW